MRMPNPLRMASTRARTIVMIYHFHQHGQQADSNAIVVAVVIRSTYTYSHPPPHSKCAAIENDPLRLTNPRRGHPKSTLSSPARCTYIYRTFKVQRIEERRLLHISIAIATTLAQSGYLQTYIGSIHSPAASIRIHLPPDRTRPACGV